jgi:hypothetical protein
MATTFEPTDRDLLERVERAAAARAAEERAAADAAAAVARAEAAAVDHARRREAAQVIERTLADARSAAAALVKCAQEWHRNIEVLQRNRDLVRTTLWPHATPHQRELIGVLADFVAHHEIQATIDGPHVTRMDRDLSELVDLRAARVAEIAETILDVPVSTTTENNLG